MGFFAGIGSAVDPTDQGQMEHRASRLIHFSLSPFKHVHPRSQSTSKFRQSVPFYPPSLDVASTSQINLRRLSTGVSIMTSNEPLHDPLDDKEFGQRPPAWMELSGDLAWTTTFSSLTQNTQITGPQDMVSYGVFFALCWQLWAAQAQYDVKFYTHDWCHRIFFIFHLLIYGGLAAFTSNFDVFWKFSSDDVYVPPDATELEKTAIYSQSSVTKQMSFLGITLVLSISRFVLLAQYLRVAYYRQKHHITSWMYFIKPLSLLLSGIIYLVCFILLRAVLEPTRGTSIMQFSLWGSALLVEVLGHAFTPDDSKDNLRGCGSISSRLSTLTVIVLGEGLNGFCSTLQHSVNSIGFGRKSITLIFSICIILYCLFLLYFEGFRQRLPPKKAIKEVWMLLHFPFHLNIIILLEGIKNIFLFVSMIISADTFFKVSEQTRDFVPSPQLERTLQKIGMSWQQEINDAAAAFEKSDMDGMIQWRRWSLEVLYKLVSTYDNAVSPEIEDGFKAYQTNDTLVELDVLAYQQDEWATNLEYDRLVNEVQTPFVIYLSIFCIIAGMMLWTLVFLAFAQERPKDRFGWGMVLSKFIAGASLMAVSATYMLPVARDPNLHAFMLLPLVAITYFLVLGVDLILLWFAVRSGVKQTASKDGIPMDEPRSWLDQKQRMHENVDSAKVPLIDSTLGNSSSDSYHKRSRSSMSRSSMDASYRSRKSVSLSLQDTVIPAQRYEEEHAPLIAPGSFATSPKSAPQSTFPYS